MRGRADQLGKQRTAERDREALVVMAEASRPADDIQRFRQDS